MASTRSGVPWKIVYYEVFGTRSEAVCREMEIKRKKSRKYIEFLISSSKPGYVKDYICKRKGAERVVRIDGWSTKKRSSVKNNYGKK